MPELPEVETVKNTLKKKLVGKQIKDVIINYSAIIEYPSESIFKDKIKGQWINNIHRRGKWLIFNLDNDYLLSHLRMEGKFFLKKNNEAVSHHEHIIFDLGDIELRYHDTRKFGRMLLINKEDIMKIGPIPLLGLEPWDEKLNIDYLKEKFKNKRMPVKAILLDQSIIAGIGNIYANEILFLSGINPLKKVQDLNEKQLGDIIENTKKILEKSIMLGGSTIHSYSSLDGINGRFQNELNVHGKEGKKCPKCSSSIIKIEVKTRGTYFCPQCQKED